METLYGILVIVAAVGAGLIGGLCFAFSSFILRALGDLGAPQAIRAMQSINARILVSNTMAVWVGTAGVGVLAAILAFVVGPAEERVLVALGAVFYVAGALGITRGGNIPLNEALDGVDPEAPGTDAPALDEAWRSYVVRWGRWNAARTALCLAAAAAFALA